MKKCPMCGAVATDDAVICYECLYSYELLSCAAMQPEAAPQEETPSAVVQPPAVEQNSGGEVDLREYQLIVSDEEFGVRHFDLSSGSLHVGRLPTNDIVLNDKTVSRRQMHVFYEAGQFWAEDFGSTNSSKLDGVPFTGKVPVRSGVLIGVRSATLEIRKK